MTDRLRHEQALSLWSGLPPGTPADLVPEIIERSAVPFRPDRAIHGITDPSLTVMLPDRPNGTSVIVAPGGSYLRIVLDKEARELAEVLLPRGVTVFLMTYRLPGEGHANAADAPLADAQRAVRLVRQHAAGWGLDPDRIGFIGFSAAGHMGASLATGFGRPVYTPVDAADTLSARPDFTALVYPVVSMEDGIAHEGSRTALLGAGPSEAVKRAYSPDLHVGADTPQTFLLFADDDPSVDAENAVRFYSALHRARVPAELHVFRDGGHGFGIREVQELPARVWPDLLAGWLERIGMIDPIA